MAISKKHYGRRGTACTVGSSENERKPNEKIIEDLKELGIKKFAMMSYGILNGPPWEFMKALRELGYRMKGSAQLLKKVMEDYPEETYKAFLMRSV